MHPSAGGAIISDARSAAPRNMWRPPALNWKVRAMRLIIAAVAVALAGFACGPASAPSPHELFKMRIAGYYWPGMYWVDVAKEKGFFREAGIDAEIFDATGDYLGSLDLVMAGRLDANLFNLYDVLRRTADGADLQFVIISDVSRGGDAVLAKPPIRSVTDLKGARVGLLVGTYQEAILASALDSAHLSLNDVTRVPLSGDPVVNARNDVDAIVSWEPLASDIAARGWKRIFDTSRFRGGVTYGYAFRREYLTRHPLQVQRFVDVWHRATKYIEAHPDEAYGIIARKYGRPPAEVAALTKSDVVLGLEENLRAFAYSAGPDSIHTTARKLNRLLIAQGHASRMMDSTLLMEPRFIRALSSQEE